MKKILLVIAIVLFLVSPVSAKEVWVLYDGGNIVGSGRIDREWCESNRDGSTTLEFIERKVAEGVSVLYLPDGKLPDPKKQKVENGKIANKTPAELEAITVAESMESLIVEREKRDRRKDAIKKLKAEGKLPADYEEE